MTEKFWQVRPREMKWFDTANPENFVGAKAVIGSGDNGTITVENALTADAVNAYSVEVVIPGVDTAAPSVEYADNVITVNLAVNTGSADLAANAATAIGALIEELTDVVKSVVVSGTGATRLQAEETADFDTAGKWATPCPDENVVLPDSSVANKYYICEVPNMSPRHTSWKTFTLASF